MSETKNSLQAIVGKDVEVSHLDGTKENVKVHFLKVSELGEYAKAFEDAATCVKLFTRKAIDWVDNLTHESADKILEIGHEMNSDFLARSVARNSELREKVIPGFGEMMKGLLSSRSPSSSPESPSESA